VCVPSAGVCTSTGDCCAVLTCNITPGQRPLVRRSAHHPTHRPATAAFPQQATPQPTFRYRPESVHYRARAARTRSLLRQRPVQCARDTRARSARPGSKGVVLHLLCLLVRAWPLVSPVSDRGNGDHRCAHLDEGAFSAAPRTRSAVPPRVHHDGSVPGDGLLDGFPGNQQEAHRLVAGMDRRAVAIVDSTMWPSPRSGLRSMSK